MYFESATPMGTAAHGRGRHNARVSGGPERAEINQWLPSKVQSLLRVSTADCAGREITAAELIESLEKAGISVFVAGGTVRDLLLGSEPNDVDLVATSPVRDMVEIVRREFGCGSVPLVNEALGLLRFGSHDRYFDLNMFRDIESVRGATSLAEVKWAYSGRPESDALTTDFTMNALYWHPGHGLVDPLGGLDDCFARRLVISADSRKAAIDPKLAFRLARFACLGYHPTDSSIAFFRKRINADAPRYGALLAPYLDELTRSSSDVKWSILTFCEANGASPHVVDLIAAAIRQPSSRHLPYASSNSASPLPA
jgi:hypothetical protein